MLEIKAPERAARGAALTAAAGAVACGVCCLLPFALPAVALAGAGGIIEAWRLSVLGNGVGRYRRGRRMDLDRRAKCKCEGQACGINHLHDGNCDWGVASRAGVVPRRTIDYPGHEVMTVIACGLLTLCFTADDGQTEK